MKYEISKTGTGASANLINRDVSAPNLTTIQVIGTSAAVGVVELTLNNVDFTSIFEFNFAGADSETFVFPGIFQDLRLNLTSNSGTVKLIAGI